MGEPKEIITVRVNIDLTAAALQAIVENAKKIAGRDENGIYRVDTAEWVNKMVSRFLMEKDFERYVGHIENYANETAVTSG
jgi:hypothetical protein